jgi:hypothetical protein
VQSVIIDNNSSNQQATTVSFVDGTRGQGVGSDPERKQNYLLMQICKEWHGDRLIWALMLEKDCSREHNNAYRRTGLVSLAFYNLCEFQALKPNMWLPKDTLMHPMEWDGGEDLRDEMSTIEWQQEKWEKRRIRLY